MLSICISFSFSFPKHFYVVRKLQHLACYVIIQIIDIFKNKIGPNTDPCGTPLKIDFQFEMSPSTLCLLSISHFSIQLIIPFPTPSAFNLSSGVVTRQYNVEWHYYTAIQCIVALLQDNLMNGIITSQYNIEWHYYTAIQHIMALLHCNTL